MLKCSLGVHIFMTCSDLSISALCKVLQADEVCVVSAIESILKTNKAIEKVKATTVEILPTVKNVCSGVKHEGSSYVYQGADLTSYSEAVAYFTAHHHEYTDSILSCRMANEESELLTHALNILATQGWGRGDDASFGLIALQYLATLFEEPLESDCSKLQGEWDDKYFNIATEENNTILWKRFNCPQSKN